MKLLIHPFLNKYGGAERKVLLLIRECKIKAIDAKVLTWKYDKKFYKEYDINDYIIQIKAPNLFFWCLKTVYFCLFKRRVNKLIAMNYPSNIVVSTISFFSLNKVESIWMCNEVSHLVNKRNFLKKFFLFAIEFVSIRFIDQIYVNSKNTYDNLLKSYNRRANEIIYSGIDVNNFDFLIRKSGLKNYKDIDYIFIGRIEKHKGIDLIIRIAKLLPNKNFYIVGDGSYRKYLYSSFKKMKNINFIKSCSEFEKICFLRRSNLFLFTSRNEPLGVAILESIYCDTKVLAFNSCGPSEIIRNNIDGILVENEEEYIKAATSIKESLFEKSSDNKKYIKLNFNQKDMINKILETWLK